LDFDEFSRRAGRGIPEDKAPEPHFSRSTGIVSGVAALLGWAGFLAHRSGPTAHPRGETRHPADLRAGARPEPA
jgi:hypothetical protein